MTLIQNVNRISNPNFVTRDGSHWGEMFSEGVFTRTIYSNSERSEQFLKQNTFVKLVKLLEVPIKSNTLKQLEFKLEKIIGI